MGHLYVVHGDLTKVAADAVLVPCDAVGEVLRHWAPFDRVVGRNTLSEELARSGRVSARHEADGRRVWFVDSGATTDTADVEWLADGIRAGVDAAVSDVTGLEAQYRRGRPLVAMPVFGVGAGGFDDQRGRALDAQLDAARQAVTGVDVDAVVVCWERADYAAVQSRRDVSHWSLSDQLRTQAELLAVAARERRLALFLGAGVSVAAGIGDFAALVAGLEREAGIPVPTRPADGWSSAQLAARIDEIQRERDEAWVRDRVAAAVDIPRYALLHGLLASLRIDEAVTTNFDRLYEQAAERPFADAPLQVLPWDRTSARSPWLLKAHGDPARSQPLVLDSRSFAGFDGERPSIAALVRSLFTLSREVLFVGYSLSDRNIRDLVDQASALHVSYGVQHSRLGTVLDLNSTAEDTSTNPVKLGLRESDGEPFSAATLRLQEFVDHIGWLVAKDEASWLLDERYGSLLADDADRDFARVVSTLQVPRGSVWQSLAAALTRWGRRST